MSSKSSNSAVLRVMYSFITVLALALTVVVLAACDNDTVAAKPNHSPFSWAGTWTSNPELMTAVISDDVIKIHLVTPESTDLYWQGTWPMTASNADGTKIVSNADVEVLALSLFGSQDLTKTFTYNNGELTFSFSMLGHTQTVHLKK